MLQRLDLRLQRRNGQRMQMKSNLVRSETQHVRTGGMDTSLNGDQE
jgi:hypothetical protein